MRVIILKRDKSMKKYGVLNHMKWLGIILLDSIWDNSQCCFFSVLNPLRMIILIYIAQKKFLILKFLNSDKLKNIKCL